MIPWELTAEIRRRLSEERGTVSKQASLTVALCYPSPYSVGMSSLGYQTIYREINLHRGASAERAFLPENTSQYRNCSSPVFTYERERPLADFPVVAFSISYELELPGMLEMLDLSGIPVLRGDRRRHHPLILAGGPLTNSNPVPLAPFADFLILGEAEQLIHEFLDAAQRMSREDLLRHFAGRTGCFVPGLSPSVPPIAKASQDSLPARSQILTRNTVLSSMFLIEPERGCSRGCTYCVMRRTTNAGMRLVSPEVILGLIPEHAGRVGLVGAAVTDHPRIRDIVRAVVEGGREIGISSLRADRLDRELVGLLARGGHRTLTTASDGASERLRKIVDRKTTERHLLRAAALTREAGMKRLKLYEMVGLPTETDADIEELIRFSLELAQIVPLTLTLSPFVAKRNTPLDGFPFEPVSSLEAKLTRLRSALKGKAEIGSASARWAWVEYMLSQGDESAGLAAMDAWRAGGSFAAWKRAFAARSAQPHGATSVPDGRRNPPVLEKGPITNFSQVSPAEPA